MRVGRRAIIACGAISFEVERISQSGSKLIKTSIRPFKRLEVLKSIKRRRKTRLQVIVRVKVRVKMRATARVKL
jgi:hypothetical protein